MESTNYPKSNIASIFVALLSLGLIFFAVILLNQTFTNRVSLASGANGSSQSSQNSQLVNNSSISLKSNSSNSKLLSSSSATIEAVIGGSTNSANLNSNSGLRSVVKITNSNTSIASNATVSTSSVKMSSQTTSQLNNEFVARYIGGGANQEDKNFQIVSCKINDPIRCKAGTEFYYSDYQTAKEGYEYKFMNPKIEDTPDKFNIESSAIIER